MANKADIDFDYRLVPDDTMDLAVDNLSPMAEVVYRRMRLKSDDFGRLPHDAQALRSMLFPRRDYIRTTLISRCLDECRKAGVLHWYVDENRRPTIELFNARQRKGKMKAKFGSHIGQQPLFCDQPEKPPPKLNGSEVKRREARDGCQLSVVSCQLSDGNVLADIRSRVGGLYKRKETDAWSYAEESALAEVCRRAEAMAELEHILVFRKSMPVEDRRRFFPQSVFKLLSTWTETLDKARVQCPVKAPSAKRPSVQNIEAEAANRKNNEMPSADILRKSIEYLEKEHPNSPILTMQREQLSRMTNS